MPLAAATCCLRLKESPAGGGGRHHREATGGSGGANRALGENGPNSGEAGGRPHSLAPLPWPLDLSRFLPPARCVSMEAASQEVPGPPGGGPSRSPSRLCRAALVAPAPLGQNQAHRHHHRPWHLLPVPASRADFRFQKYVTWLLSVEFNDGLCEAGRAGPGWAGALRLFKAKLPSRSGLCSSGSARGSSGLLHPWSRSPALLQNPVRNPATWARPSLPPFPLHLHLEPGGTAILDHPMYHLRPQRGKVEKQTVWSGETPPGPPGPEEWQQLYV